MIRLSSPKGRRKTGLRFWLPSYLCSNVSWTEDTSRNHWFLEYPSCESVFDQSLSIEGRNCYIHPGSGTVSAFVASWISSIIRWGIHSKWTIGFGQQETSSPNHIYIWAPESLFSLTEWNFPEATESWKRMLILHQETWPTWCMLVNTLRANFSKPWAVQKSNVNCVLSETTVKITDHVKAFITRARRKHVINTSY